MNEAVRGNCHRQRVDNVAWTDITYLLHKQISWAYYVETGTSPTAKTTRPLARRQQSDKTPGIWNPLPIFADVQQDHQLGNVRSLDAYLRRPGRERCRRCRGSRRPANSEHPPASVHQGQA